MTLVVIDHVGKDVASLANLADTIRLEPSLDLRGDS